MNEKGIKNLAGKSEGKKKTPETKARREDPAVGLFSLDEQRLKMGSIT
jgi:hypothetical protein